MRAKQFLRKINEAAVGDGDVANAVVAEVIKLIGEGHTEVSPDVITTKVSAALGRPFMLKDLVAANNNSPELQHYIDSINPSKIKFSTDILTVKNQDPAKEKEKAEAGVASMASRAANRPRLGEGIDDAAKDADYNTGHKKGLRDAKAGKPNNAKECISAPERKGYNYGYKSLKESDQGISKSAETKFHKKLDTLVHDTFGKRKEEMKEGGVPWTGTTVAVYGDPTKAMKATDHVDLLDINTAAQKYGLNPDDIKNQLKSQDQATITGTKGAVLVARPVGGERLGEGWGRGNDRVTLPDEPSLYWNGKGPLSKEYNELYAALVPSMGAADTIEGEVLRAASKIVYRHYNDGDEFNEASFKQLEEFIGKVSSYDDLAHKATVFALAAEGEYHPNHGWDSLDVMEYGPEEYDDDDYEEDDSTWYDDDEDEEELDEGWKSALATGAMGAALAFGGSGAAQAGQSPDQAPQKASAPAAQQTQAQNPYHNDLGVLVGVAQSKGGMQVLGKILSADQIQQVKAAYAKAKADPNLAKSAQFKQGQQLGFELGNSYADSSSQQMTDLNKRGPSYAGILSPMVVKPGEARSAEDITKVNQANAGKLKQAVTAAYGNMMAGGLHEGWESGPEERAPRERDPDAEYDDMRQQKADAPYAQKEPVAKGYQVVDLTTKQPVVDTMFATKGEAMAYIMQHHSKNLAYRAIYEGRETPLRDKEDYQAKKKALQDIQMDPHTSKDPELSAEVIRRLAGLEKQRSELK